MRTRNWISCPGTGLLTIVFIWLAMLSGCGGDGRLAVYPVRGKVVYRDRGIPDTTVIFQPADANSEAAARNMHPYGETDSSGNFELSTYVTGDGVPAGEYQVIVIAPSKISPSEGGREDPNRFDGDDFGKLRRTIPQDLRQRYAKPETSGLTVTVKPGENKLEPFVLQ